MCLHWLLSAAAVYFFFLQAEAGIRDLVRSRGLGDVYKRQNDDSQLGSVIPHNTYAVGNYAVTSWYTDGILITDMTRPDNIVNCLLYTSDAADERSSVDLGGRRIIKKKKYKNNRRWTYR